MRHQPNYKVGYTFDDNLDIVTEVRCYVTDDKPEWDRDPLGQKAAFLVDRKESTWHSRQYFFKDDNHLLRTLE